MLSAKKVERAQRPGRYPCGLIKGLSLQVTESGAKSWVLRYQLRGDKRWLGLGSAADFSLKEARERARAARQLLADGIDPLERKQAAASAAKLAAARKLTFAEAAAKYFDQHADKWRNRTHRDAFLSTLKTYVFPAIGNVDVAAIETPDVLRVLEPIWPTMTVTADRIRSRIELVLDWAVVRGHGAAGNGNPARWKGHLSEVLPAPRKLKPIVHHAAMDYRQVPGFLAELRGREQSVAALALEFTVMTAARTGEVRGATWAEIDLVDKVWTVPAERMKAHKEHRVPLSSAAVDLLRKLPRSDDNPHVFIGLQPGGLQPGAGLSRMAMTYALERTGRTDVTIHGFRSAFRDFAGESTAFAHDVCEAALAHVRGDQSVRAYARGDLFNKRRQLMESWSQFCSSRSTKAAVDNVVPMGGAR
jgi:integrase